MLLTNYIFAISAALAFKDYFRDTEKMYKVLKNGKEVDEVNKINSNQEITSTDEIQIFSLAVHGKKIEENTEDFSQNLYDRVIGTRKKSVLYSFLSNINSTQSGDYYNGRCIPNHCCKAIILKNGKDVDNTKNYGDGRKLKEKEKCEFDEVCYLNAAHVTSEKFRTEKLNKSLPNRYPVSFHGFQDKNDKKGSPVDVVLGGLSKQKYELAEKYHNLTKGAIKIAICRSGNNCKVYDPNNDDFDTRTPVEASGLSGSHEKNFVNLGKHKCGLQLELSTTFRKSKGEKSKYWRCLIDSIFNTLPKKKEGESEGKEKERICDDMKFYVKSSNDTED